jgi:hypothetical protein
MGVPVNRWRQGLASHRAQRADLLSEPFQLRVPHLGFFARVEGFAARIAKVCKDRQLVFAGCSLLH